MSKPITAVAMMILWERGFFTLDDPLYKFIPEFKDVKVLVMDKSQEKGYRLEPAKSPITIRHLLSHTSGISYGFFAQPVISQCYLDNQISDGFRITNGTIGEMTKRLAKCPLVFQPGTGWQYGLNFDVLGHVVEVISGMPFDQFLQKNVFDPLKMNDTSFFVPENKLNRLMALYSPTPEGTLQKLDHQVAMRGLIADIPSMVYDGDYSYKGPKTYFSGGAGLHSTAADYMRFCEMMLNGGELDGERILSPVTVKLMTQNQIGEHNVDIAPPGVKYGLGFSVVIDKVMSGSVTPEGTYSWSGIYNTAFYIDPKHKMIASFYNQLMPSFHVMGLSRPFEILTQTSIIKE
jgi:CubicO group peptidase (beta-lactamase class C family)